MDSNNKTYKLKAEVLTPVSTGAGNDNDWQNGSDYIISNGKLYVINFGKAVKAGVDAGSLTDYLLKADSFALAKLLGDKLSTISDYIFDCPIKTANPIKTQARNRLYDTPVIPGSSLKGAIRSVLGKHFKQGREVNDYDFGSLKDGTDFMRFIRISDCEMPYTVLQNTKIFNLQSNGKGGWKHEWNNTTERFKSTGFNTLYECIPEVAEGVLTISLKNDAYELSPNSAVPSWEKKELIMTNGIEHLFSIINEHTETYLNKEKHFFETYTADRSHEIIDNIDYLLNIMPTDSKSCVLKMSAGSGFHSITGDWKYDDYTDTGIHEKGKDKGKKKYKSRKIADGSKGLSLMGFVRISIIDDEEFEYIQNKINEKHKEVKEALKQSSICKEEERKASIRKIEAARQKAEEEKIRQEELAKIEKEKEEKRQRADLLAEEARKLVSQNNYTEALSKYEAAEVLCPNAYQALITDCKQKIHQQKVLGGNIQQLLDSIITLSSPAAFANKFKNRYIGGKYKADDEIRAIAQWLREQIENQGDRKLKSIWTNRSKWSPLEQCFGKANTDDLFNMFYQK